MLARRSIQNSVSAASFNAICSLVMKSAFDWAYIDSLMFAPIDVPDRKICFDSTFSWCILQRYLLRFTILTAKALLLSFNALFSELYIVFIAKLVNSDN